MAKLRNKLKTLLIQKYGIEGDIPSQENLAVQMGLTQNTLSRWMRGKISRFDEDSITKICVFLDCEVGDLLYIDRSAEPA